MSAHAEDLVIFNAFFKDDPKLWNKNSFYLEIGGHNGVLESNTRFFDVCLGWDGLLVEPIPQSYHRMVKLRPSAHHLWMSPSCEEPSIAKFHDQPYTSGIANAEGATLEIHCGPLSHPFRQLGIRHINFWSLDVEGSELAILKRPVQIDIIMAESQNRLVEKQQMAIEVRGFLKQRGYTLMKSVEVTASDIFVHQSVCPKYKQCIIDAGM